MSTHERPPSSQRVRRQYLHEIEFFGNITTSRSHHVDMQRESCIRARLLDPRLQRVIAAAANGWVVERFVDSVKVTSKTLPG
jgi:hypothetical protein